MCHIVAGVNPQVTGMVSRTANAVHPEVPKNFTVVRIVDRYSSQFLRNRAAAILYYRDFNGVHSSPWGATPARAVK